MKEKVTAVIERDRSNGTFEDLAGCIVQAQAKADACAIWDVHATNTTSSPGPGWEPFTHGPTYLYWRKRRLT